MLIYIYIFKSDILLNLSCNNAKLYLTEMLLPSSVYGTLFLKPVVWHYRKNSSEFSGVNFMQVLCIYLNRKAREELDYAPG